jgi:hypothetical protein
LNYCWTKRCCNDSSTWCWHEGNDNVLSLQKEMTSVKRSIVVLCKISTFGKICIVMWKNMQKGFFILFFYDKNMQRFSSSLYVYLKIINCKFELWKVSSRSRTKLQAIIGRVDRTKALEFHVGRSKGDFDFINYNY